MKRARQRIFAVTLALMLVAGLGFLIKSVLETGDGGSGRAMGPSSGPEHSAQAEGDRRPADASRDQVHERVEVARTGSLSVHVLFDTGRPAARAAFIVEKRDGRSREWVRECRTNPRGVFVLENLQAGEYLIHTLRSAFDAQWARVEAGRRTRVDLSIGTGLEVSGQVVDRHGRPVPDAQIEWVVSGTGRERPVRCGRSDADGRFAVTAVPKRAYLGARKRGFTTSLYAWAHTSGASLTLRLDSPGGVVAGRVVDAEGDPVPRATVIVGGGNERFANAMSVEYGRSLRELSCAASTDAEGRFEVVGVPVGDRPASSQRIGVGVWEGRTTVHARAVATVFIKLRAPARIRAHVRDTTARPVQGARGSATHITSRRSKSGRTNHRGLWLAANLASGPVDVRVFDGLHDYTRRVELSPGNEQRLDFEVSARGRVEGVAKDAAGAPVEGLIVCAEVGPSRLRFAVPSSRVPWRRQRETDERGAFAFEGAPREAPMRLVALQDDRVVGLLDGVQPDAGQVVLRVDVADIGYGSIRGSVVLEGRSPDSVNVALVREGGKRRSQLRLNEDGAFFRRVTAGQYEVRVSGAGVATTRRRVRVSAQEVADTGKLALALGGRIEMRVTGAYASSAKGLVVVDATGRRVADTLVRRDRPSRTTLLRSGDYTVYVLGDVFAEAVRCRVHAGRTTRAQILVRSGRRVRLYHRGEGRLQSRREVLVRITRRGTTVCERRVWAGHGGEWSLGQSLEPGEYSVEWTLGLDPPKRSSIGVRDRTQVVELR